jgi:hypothetical protein
VGVHWKGFTLHFYSQLAHFLPTLRSTNFVWSYKALTISLIAALTLHLTHASWFDISHFKLHHFSYVIKHCFKTYYRFLCKHLSLFTALVSRLKLPLWTRYKIKFTLPTCKLLTHHAENFILVSLRTRPIYRNYLQDWKTRTQISSFIDKFFHVYTNTRAFKH